MTKRREATAPRSTAIAIAVIGDGATADVCARNLRGIDGVEIARGGGDGDVVPEQLTRDDVAAVAFAAPVADLGGATKRALVAGRDVFVAMPSALASKQLRALDDIARRRRGILMFDACGLADERVAFARKMTGGDQALWRPRYVRSLRTGVALSLDEAAIADVGVLLSILSALPVRVSAVAPRPDDETGATDAASITLMFEDGLIGRIDVSLIEPAQRQEIAIACDGRTLHLDALDARAPLQIHAASAHRGPRAGAQWAETVNEHPVGAAHDHDAATAAAFVAAVRARDLAAGNAAAIADAASVWETARESIARGGEMMDVLGASPQLVTGTRPALKLIRGGGRTTDQRPAPTLTLVGREHEADDAPRSA